MDKEVLACMQKSLPDSMLLQAAKQAINHNPQNRPMLAYSSYRILTTSHRPGFLAALTSKWWRTGMVLTVSFMDSPPKDLQDRIVSHLNAWNKTANISFRITSGDGLIRITRGEPGYWSYIGTDLLIVEKKEPTMCLSDFTMRTPESEFHRVVRHEGGHCLGFVHEHSRAAIIDLLDTKKTLEYFETTQGWRTELIEQQILTPIPESELTGNVPELTSIMCYQFPGAITKTGKPILGGLDITPEDYAESAKIYPGKPIEASNLPPSVIPASPFSPSPVMPLHPLPPPPFLPIPPLTMPHSEGVNLPLDGSLVKSTIQKPGGILYFLIELKIATALIFTIEANLGLYPPHITLEGEGVSYNIELIGTNAIVKNLLPGHYTLTYKYNQNWRIGPVGIRCWKFK